MDLAAARRRIARTGAARWCQGWGTNRSARQMTPADLATLQCVRRCANFCLAVFLANRRRRCLPRSLVLYRWACRLGLEASWHMALDRRGTSHDGHSWVAIAGQPLFESPDLLARMVEVYRYPPATATPSRCPGTS